MITARHFKEKEFGRCNPPCSLQNMDQGFMDLLDRLRDEAGIPLILNSAYRTPAHELAHSRPGTSSHCQGRAVDIRCTDSGTRFKILEAAVKLGIRRIGVAHTYIHIDNDPDKAQGVIWDYNS